MDEGALLVPHGTHCHWLDEVSCLHGGGLFNHRRPELADRLLGGHSYSRQHSCVYARPSEQPHVNSLPYKQLQTRV